MTHENERNVTFFPLKKLNSRAIEMAQSVKMLSAKSDDLSVIPGTHLVERIDLHMCSVSCVSPGIHDCMCMH